MGQCCHYPARTVNYKWMTLEELEREYVALRQQGEAVRSYL
jgi:hypothetical protein